MITRSVALSVAWGFVLSAASILFMQLVDFQPARGPLLPLNMIVAGIFFLVAKP